MLNKKPSGNKKQKSSNVKPIIAGFGIGLMTLAGCGITNPPACNCPDKIHGNAPCDCGGIDCTCKQKEYSLATWPITIVDETGGLITQELLTKIDNAFSYCKQKVFDSSEFDTVMAWGDGKWVIKNNLSEDEYNVSEDGRTAEVGMVTLSNKSIEDLFSYVGSIFGRMYSSPLYQSRIFNSH
jgi:hypothetical protein